MTGIGVSTYGSGRAIIDTGAITMVDTIFFNLGFIQDCSVKAKNPFAFLGNETFALQCPENECGNNGIKSKISSLNITSDSLYNSQPSNTSVKLSIIWRIMITFEKLYSNGNTLYNKTN